MLINELIKGKEKTDELIAIKKSSNKVLFTSNDSSTHIKVFENFDNTWRKVGIAIDRLEFNVEDRVRSDGIYFIKYRDPTIDQKKKGFFSNLFSLGGSSNKIQVFQIKLRSEADATKIFVIDEQGEKNSVTTKSIASILFDQLI